MNYAIWVTLLIVILIGIILTASMYTNNSAKKYLPKILLLYTIISIIAIITVLLYSNKKIKDTYTNTKTETNRHNHQLVKNRKIIDNRLASLSSQVLGTEQSPLYIIDDYLTPEQCDALIKSNEGKFKKSPLTREIKGFRTSVTSFFDWENPIQKEVDDMILETMDSDPKFGETPQMQHYEVGNEFKGHYDWFHRESDKSWYDRGQRTWTFMIYLNDVEEGGETEFMELGVKVKPKKGRVVIWGNMLENNMEDYKVKHAGTPVIKGNKSIITKWFKKEHNDF
jgi:prolyl 4-hydroxylase